MNKTQNQNSYQQSDRKAGGENIKGSALDRFSLPVWVVGGALALVVLLMVFSGWKIVNLEREKIEIDYQRSDLEEKKNEYALILKELPTLKNKRISLKEDIKKLEGDMFAAKTILDSFVTQNQSANSQLQKAIARRQTEQAKADESASKQSNISNKIERAKRERNLLEPQVAALRRQEEVLRNDVATLKARISDRKKENATLDADKSGLNRELANLRNLKDEEEKNLNRMTKDKDKLISLSKRINEIADSAERAIRDLNQQKESLTSAVADINGQKKIIIEQGKKFSSEIDNLRTSVLKIEKASMSAESAKDKIESAADKAGEQARRIQQAIDGPLKILQDNATSLSSASEALRTSIRGIEGNEGTLQEKVGALNVYVRELQNSKADMDGLISHLFSVDTNLSDARLKLASEIDDVKKLVDRSRIQIGNHSNSLDTTFQNLETRLGKLKEKISELEQLLQKSIKANNRLQNPKETNQTQTQGGE